MNKHPESVAVFCPNWVGDVVMATPVFSSLRDSYPEAEIICVIRKYARPVIDDSPWFDRVVDINDKSIRGFFRLVLALRKIKPDITILLRNSLGSAMISRLGGAKEVYGYRRDGRSFLLTDGPEPLLGEKGYLPMPMVDYYMELCRFLDLSTPGDTRPRLYMSTAVAEAGEKLLHKYGISDNDRVIGINPGAKFGSSKCWPPEYFAKLADLFEDQLQCKVMLMAGPGEEEIARSITEKSSARIINTSPDRIDLAVLKYLIKRCGLLVTNDTGTRHYAVAFDIPVLVIMGPTNAAYTAANLEKTRVLRRDLDCSPCHKKKCPLGHHECMKGIFPDDAFRESLRLLDRVNA